MAIPSYFKRLFREYVTGEGSSEVANQSPVQSVNSKTGDVTINVPVDSVNGETGTVTLSASDVNALADTYSAPVQSVNSQTGDVTVSAGGVIPSTQTVASYSDLPLTNRSQAEMWYVSGERDIVSSTQLSPVVWRSVSDYTAVASAIPDTSMFDGVEYHFWAGSDNGVSYDSSGPFDEVISDNDAVASSSDVVLKESYEGGYDMYVYPDLSGSDYHSFDADVSLLGDKFSVFALADFEARSLKTDEASRNYPVWFSLNDSFGYGAIDDDDDGNRDFGFVNFGGNTAALITSTDGLTALGAEPDLTNNTHNLYAEGSEASGSSSTSIDSDSDGVQTFDIGAPSNQNEGWAGGVSEVIICNQHQSKSAYDTWRADRDV